MITSMTGFGSIEKDNKDFSIEINIRSENNRFFDGKNKFFPLYKTFFLIL